MRGRTAQSAKNCRIWLSILREVVTVNKGVKITYGSPSIVYRPNDRIRADQLVCFRRGGAAPDDRYQLEMFGWREPVFTVRKEGIVHNRIRLSGSERVNGNCRVYLGSGPLSRLRDG